MRIISGVERYRRLVKPVEAVESGRREMDQSEGEKREHLREENRRIGKKIVEKTSDGETFADILGKKINMKL